MKYLVDANVLSEATKPEPAHAVLQWMSHNRNRLWVNPIILGELEYGILLLAPGRRRTRLEMWIKEGLKRLRVLEIDRQTARCWAVLLADLKREGKAMPLKDSLIAATAKQHRLTIATRNVDDYHHAGVRLVNPFAQAEQ